LAKDYPGLRLRMLGSGDPGIISKLKNKSVTSSLPDRLDLVGFVKHEELPVHLSRAHVFAAPSKYEGGPGLVYLEAMACGLPVIACEGSGVAEVVVHGENGLLVPPEDLDALVKALHQLLSDPEECLEMGKRARRYVMREADSRICIKRLEEFYASVAEHSSRVKG